MGYTVAKITGNVGLFLMAMLSKNIIVFVPFIHCCFLILLVAAAPETVPD